MIRNVRYRLPFQAVQWTGNPAQVEAIATLVEPEGFLARREEDAGINGDIVRISWLPNSWIVPMNHWIVVHGEKQQGHIPIVLSDYDFRAQMELA